MDGANTGAPIEVADTGRIQVTTILRTTATTFRVNTMMTICTTRKMTGDINVPGNERPGDNAKKFAIDLFANISHRATDLACLQAIPPTRDSKRTSRVQVFLLFSPLLRAAIGHLNILLRPLILKYFFSCFGTLSSAVNPSSLQKHRANTLYCLHCDNVLLLFSLHLSMSMHVLCRALRIHEAMPE